MSVKAKVAYFQRSITEDRQAIRWLQSEWAPRTLARESELGWEWRALHWHLALLREYAAKLLPPWPPHHLLWLCISHGEGGIHSINPNGHYGMLQMHADWGYGTSHHASDDSQMVQEWAAEHAYKASGYSQGFLWQQWAADARCFA